MVDVLLLLGLAVACFVAYNIGGATTGPSFGPAVGASIISKSGAALLMSVCFIAGAWTLGRRVVDTLGEDLVYNPAVFTLEASIVILFFIGGALLIGNLTGAPSSTSMTAVGAIAGFAFAVGELNIPILGEIVIWWILSPVIGFWISVTIGRYLYPHIDQLIAIDRSDGPLLTIKYIWRIPIPRRHESTTNREIIGAITVIGIGCLMAFSSGASNIANAIAPLVGSGEVGMNAGIVIGSAAFAIGAYTIARRTMETLGNDITDLPLTAAIIVAVVSSTIVIFLSAIGIPVQFVVIATLSIVGLGWGRATRTVTIAEAVRQDKLHVSVGGLRMDETAPTVGEPARRKLPKGDVEPIGNESVTDVPATSDLFDPSTTGRIVLMQTIVPLLATVGCYLTFLTILG